MEENNNQVVEKTEAKPAPNKQSSFWEMVRFVVIALLIVIPIRAYVAQPFVVSGSSMYPTFKDGDYLIIDEISYRLKEPTRDDVIVFRYPNDPKKFFIKRVIGLPGETVDVKSGVVTIYNEAHKEGLTLDDSYVINHSGGDAHKVLGEDEYFVMGDNRPASSDSRYWGSVPKNNIIGRALIRLLPIKNIGLNPGEFKQDE